MAAQGRVFPRLRGRISLKEAKIGPIGVLEWSVHSREDGSGMTGKRTRLDMRVFVVRLDCSERTPWGTFPVRRAGKVSKVS